MKEFGLFINGEWEAAKGGATMESINPATEEPWVKVAKADAGDVDRAVAAAWKMAPALAAGNSSVMKPAPCGSTITT